MNIPIAYNDAQVKLLAEPRSWLVTGVGGFIGSNLLEALLKLNQRVTGLDNFSTGRRKNLEEVERLVSPAQWLNFRFIEGDITDLAACRTACASVDHILHQAALGSVPRSIQDPLCTNATNISGFLNMLIAARDAKVKSFVYAASSSTYGDHPDLPKIEPRIGRPLSPYAVTKYVNELYAEVFARCYGLKSIGLRYFNVFGERQDPNGAYAAVIPTWTAALLRDEAVYVNGDGTTSRDFCYVANTVQANVLAATTENPTAVNQVYNIAIGERTTLQQLFDLLRDSLVGEGVSPETKPVYRNFRAGDVRHSQADITKARHLLGYEPTHNVVQGLRPTLQWYIANQPD